MTEPATSRPDPLPVPAHLCSLLCSIADGWTPAPLALGQVLSIHYGDIDLSNTAPSVYIEDSKLVAVVDSFSHQSHRNIPGSLNSNGTLSGTLSGDYIFEGDLVCSLGCGNHVSIKEKNTSDSLIIKTSNWHIRSDVKPSVWIGRLGGELDIERSGNLIIERREHPDEFMGIRQHLFLSGAYSYYLVQQGANQNPAWYIVIETQQTENLDMNVLGLDFLVIQFVLGRQLRMPDLLGITSDQHTIAWRRGCSTQRHIEKNSYPPVPLGQTNVGYVDTAWSALFFSKISQAWRDNPKSHNVFRMAMGAYLDSMSNHLDSDYMKLQIALEAFAKWLLSGNPQNARMNVKDESKWKKWVNDHSAEIMSHAETGREKVLIDKLISVSKQSSSKSASSERVPVIFSHYGLVLRPEMKKELIERNTIAHQSLMSPEGYDVDRDLRRVALVRSMLVGLLAKAVEYAGAINGWELEELGKLGEVGELKLIKFGYPAEPPSDWWAIDDAARQHAQKTYIAEEISSR